MMSSYAKPYGVAFCWIGVIAIFAGGIILKVGYYDTVSSPTYPVANLCLLGEMSIVKKECVDTEVCCQYGEEGACSDYCIRYTCYSLTAVLSLQEGEDRGATFESILVDDVSLAEAWEAYGNYTDGEVLRCYVSGCCLAYAEGCPSYEQPDACVTYEFESPVDTLYGGSMAVALGVFCVVAAIVCLLVYR